MTPLKPFELSIGNLLNYDTGEGIELTVIDWQDLKWLQEEPDFFANHFPPFRSPLRYWRGLGLSLRKLDLECIQHMDLICAISQPMSISKLN